MSLAPNPAFEQRIAAVRHFSRFYTRQIGLLEDGLLQTPFSLTQGRVLYELARRGPCTATDLVAALGIDHGYLSRILRGFEDRDLVMRKRNPDDGRQLAISLTTKGHKAFAALDHRSQQGAAKLLCHLGSSEQDRVVEAMATIERLVAGQEPPRAAPIWILRPPKPGDMGWVVQRHGTLYPGEYGWDRGIEALTAEIVANFLKNFDPARECCWIAEMDGEPVGSVFIVKETDEVARLRLLIVDPKARGQGVGRRLVEECIAFSRKAEYRSITLWTHRVLTAAREIYRKAGFRLTKEWVHDDFGKPEAAETWDLSL